jgi:hypothetical protein
VQCQIDPGFNIEFLSGIKLAFSNFRGWTSQPILPDTSRLTHLSWRTCSRAASAPLAAIFIPRVLAQRIFEVEKSSADGFVWLERSTSATPSAAPLWPLNCTFDSPRQRPQHRIKRLLLQAQCIFIVCESVIPHERRHRPRVSG